jgi:rhodanese-related sulfurtransferase
MISYIKTLFSSAAAPNYKELLDRGATIVDVRTPGEFASGNVHGSLNIPLQTLSSGIKKLSKTKPVILCCASGMRSAQAKHMLESQGFQEVYDAGSWMRLQRMLQQQ